MTAINVGIIGVGNCASSLVQGVEYYADAEPGTPGVANPICAGYSVADIRFTSAFDVNAEKLGFDLSKAIWSAPNNALKFVEVPDLKVPVHDGILADGIGDSTAGHLAVRGHATLSDVVAHLRGTQTRVLVNFLPTGSQHASEQYADAALQAGCAFVNCIPSTLARSTSWASKFQAAGLPLIGDDLKSQFGSTLVHHGLVELLRANGLHLRNTYQIVSGGNMDFLNLQDPDRVASKRTTKIQGIGGTESASASTHFGAEYIPFLEDRKIAFIRFEAEAFGGTLFELELKMSVEDSPSAAGNVLDAVRYARFAMERGIGGVLDSVSALLMKAPPHPLDSMDALNAVRSFVAD